MRRKRSVYAKTRESLLRSIKNLNRKGYILKTPLDLPTETQLRKQGIKGQELAKRTRQLKKIRKDFTKQEVVSTRTGEIQSVFRARRETQRQRKKQKQKAQQYYPDGGRIITQNMLDEYISRLGEVPRELYDLQEQLNAPIVSNVVDRAGRIRRRKSEATNTAEQGRVTILNLLNQKIAELGESAVGWIFQENAEEIQDYVGYMLYGSDASKIASATTKLAEVINQGELDLKQLIDLSEQEEVNETWEPDV